jgi:autotransporter passenger strand-loop-strand repeat protein
VLRGGRAGGTIITSGGYELVSSGGTAVATAISGGTLEVASGGTASGVFFSSGGMFQLDSGAHLVGAISGFHLGDEIDLRGLAYSSGSSTASWTQKTSGASASGTLTVKEGTHSMTLTLVGSYTSGNFTVASDGHGGTLITDPPVTSGGGWVATGGDIASSSSVDTAPSSAGTVVSGGYELGASGGTAGDTSSGGDTAGVFVSDGGMVQLDALLAQFAGVVSGFELDLRSLGFDALFSAMPWMQQASGIAGGDASGLNGGFSLALLDQYAANFSAGAEDGPLITVPAVSSSVAPPPSVVAHS